jgi:4-diphosphocytidyl-2-C-methyl-D-erythritol kinase
VTELVRRAPAKLNLTLEILGPRADGYHELRSVMSTLSLHDTLTVSDGRGVVVSADESYDGSVLPSAPNERNTVETALALVVARQVRPESDAVFDADAALRDGLERVALRLRKEIPAAAGLGGGSSDAVAALRALSQYWAMELGNSELLELAARIGSDCPFFVSGGVQLASGRGERLTPLPAPAPIWICLLKPPFRRRAKTAQLFSLLRAEHFADGRRSALLARRLQQEPGCRVQPADLCNGFDAVADQAFGCLDAYRAALEAQGAEAVHLCGSGPTLYGLFESELSAQGAEAALRADHFDAWALRSPAPGE